MMLTLAQRSHRASSKSQSKIEQLITGVPGSSCTVAASSPHALRLGRMSFSAKLVKGVLLSGFSHLAVTALTLSRVDSVCPGTFPNSAAGVAVAS